MDKKRAERLAEHKEVAKKFYEGMKQDSDYIGEDYDVFSSWLGSTE